MHGVYAPGAFDIAGTLVGVAERAALLPRPDVAAGDVLIGVASSGPHTNGYSLLRRLFAWIPLHVVPEGMDRPLGEALLEPHRSYLDVLAPALATGQVKALAHITGGGLPEASGWSSSARPAMPPPYRHRSPRTPGGSGTSSPLRTVRRRAST